jgi:galactokinase
VHHSLAASEYNARRKECEKGLQILKDNSSVQSFRDVKSVSELEKYKDKMGETVFKRCLYVVEEIERTKRAAQLLQNNDITGFGKLMFETHEGLRNLYEVSSKELDFLVDAAKHESAIVGSRLMGGGFGGCTINVIKKDGVEPFLSEILPEYKNKFQTEAEVYDVKVVNGTHQL